MNPEGLLKEENSFPKDGYPKLVNSLKESIIQYKELSVHLNNNIVIQRKTEEIKSDILTRISRELDENDIIEDYYWKVSRDTMDLAEDIEYAVLKLKNGVSY